MDESTREDILSFYTTYFEEKHLEWRALVPSMKVSHLRKAKKTMVMEVRNDYALQFPCDDNYMTKPSILAEVYRRTKWKPLIDLFCSPGGANA